MPFILGIDTAGPRGSIALAEDGAGGEAAPLAPGGHSSGLAPEVVRLLAARGLALGDLAGIAVSGGPGSFTGLRIGLAWAKGVAMGAGVPLLLVPAHEAMAHAARRLAPRFATATQGERGRVLAALWKGGDAAALLWGPESVPEDDLVERARAAAGGGAIPVAAATEAIEELVLDGEGTLLALPPLAPSIAEVGAQMLARGETADIAAAAPAYGRAPNARKPAPRQGGTER